MKVGRPKIVDKEWGHEKWIVNKPEYCGKLMYFIGGCECSFHYHVKKDETFYVHSGHIIINYSLNNDLEHSKMIILHQGDAFHVPRGMRHRISAVSDSEIFEFSTEHFEDDSIRITRSKGKYK